MQSYIKVPRTEYPAYLERRLEEMAWQGRAGFSFRDISNYTKLPITGNMRRRIQQLVDSGDLLNSSYKLPGRGVEKTFNFAPGRWKD